MLLVIQVRIGTSTERAYARDLALVSLDEDADTPLTKDLQRARVYVDQVVAQEAAQRIYEWVSRHVINDFSVCPVEVRRKLELTS